MRWYTPALRIVLLLGTGTALGWWLYGRPLEALLLVLLCMVAFWLYQVRRVQHWLRDQAQPPPDIAGIHGHILRQVYRQQQEERKLREELQSTADFFRSSFSSMREGVVIVDSGSNITWANGAAAQLTGLRFPEDAGQPLLNLIRVPEFNAYLQAGKFAEPLQYYANQDVQRSLQVEVTDFGLGDRLLFFRDVTEKLRVEQMRRDFVANVSHELRTPLTVITGYLGTFLGAGFDLSFGLFVSGRRFTITFGLRLLRGTARHKHAHAQQSHQQSKYSHRTAPSSRKNLYIMCRTILHCFVHSNPRRTCFDVLLNQLEIPLGAIVRYYLFA